jgi:hypothetical protein
MFENWYEKHELKYEANKEIYESNQKRKSSIIADIDKLHYTDKQKLQTLLDLSTNLLHQAHISKSLLNSNSDFSGDFDKKVLKNKFVMIGCALVLVALTAIFGIGIEIISAFVVLVAYFIHFKIEEYSIKNRCILLECVYKNQLDYQTIELFKIGLNHFDIFQYSNEKRNVENQMSDTVLMETALLEFEKNSLKRDQKILSKNFVWD